MNDFDSKTRPGNPLFSTDQRLPESIRNLDMGPILWTLMNPEEGAAKTVDWNEPQTVRVIEEYRKFLTLSHEGDGKVTSPSKNVDVIWHTHVLDTAKYYTDMHKIFGHMVHHFPYLGVRGSADRQVLLDGYEDTKVRYRERFTEVAPEDVWGSAAHCGTSHCSRPRCGLIT